jgi:hypothetical protein
MLQRERLASCCGSDTPAARDQRASAAGRSANSSAVASSNHNHQHLPAFSITKGI